MVDEHGLAVEEIVAGEYDLAGRRRLDRGAGLGGEIQARVRVALLAVEETAQAERRGQRAVHRAVEQQIARLAGAELPVGAVLLIQFTLDALEVCGVRVDLTLVLQGDVLRAIVAVANLEAGAAAIDLQLLGAGLCRQRDADDGDPALAILAHHQGRLALIAGLRCAGAVAEFDHGDAAGHRFVQQAGDEAFGVGRQCEGEGEQQGEDARHGWVRCRKRPILA